MQKVPGRSCRKLCVGPQPAISEDAPRYFQFLGLTAVLASRRMHDVLRFSERAARTSAAVLITGESGSGKELIARAIHHYSLRSHKPWVDVSCATLPEHLMESELFGYEKGAFSGADSLKQGLYELASGGTLFLDEVAELSPKMQVKLLRVLDGTPYYRLGGVRKITADVRIVTATSRDLEKAAAAGEFRRDLYHRLRQVHIHVPPLRERVEDIAPLAEFFLRQQNPALSFGPGTLAALERRRWPGNVRELRNAIVHAVVATEGRVIRAADLPPDTDELEPALPDPPAGALDGMERQMILRYLGQTGGHRRRAAELLGISSRTLRRKLKLYKVNETAVSNIAP